MKKAPRDRCHPILLAALAVIFIAGCATPPSAPGPEVLETAPSNPDQESAPSESWRVVAQGTLAAVRVPVAQVVREQGSWVDAWAAIHANKSEPPARPAVDLASESLLLILLGQRSTGGYQVNVQAVDTTKNPITVTIAVTSPAPGDVVTQALTSPYVVVAIPATDREVLFQGDDISLGYEGE